MPKPKISNQEHYYALILALVEDLLKPSSERPKKTAKYLKLLIITQVTTVTGVSKYTGVCVCMCVCFF